MERIFDKNNVILTQISEADLESFLVEFDISDTGEPLYLLDDLTKALINTIPEYVSANYEDPSIPQNDTVEKLRLAAKSIYKIEEYDLMRQYCIATNKTEKLRLKTELITRGFMHRGEFGELLLHLLLREFHCTVPLVSKVYFKDSAGVPAHGFDAVHISAQEKILWLGESKFYSDSKKGLKALLEDLTTHFTHDYLNEQIVVIKKNLNNNSIPQREEWIKQLNECSKLKELINIVNIPLLCMFPNDIYKKYQDFSVKDAIDYHEMTVRDLKSYFDKNNSHPLKSKLNIILMLFPVRNKKELVLRLHERLWHMQNM
jgi:hypothetical protein